MRDALPIHGEVDHRANGPDPIPVVVHVLCFGPEDAVETADAVAWYTIGPDLAGTRLRRAHACVYTAGGSALEVQLHNLDTTDDLFASPLTVFSGQTDTFANLNVETIATGTPPTNRVSLGDRIRIDVLDNGACIGLEVRLEFGPEILRLT